MSEKKTEEYSEEVEKIFERNTDSINKYRKNYINTFYAKLLADRWFDDVEVKHVEEDEKDIIERKTELVKELSEVGVDPLVFDSLVSNEVDRDLKIKFGVSFLVLSVIFTISSYLIVILNGIYSWGISGVAITALIIETPIQFIGLLYIIARNLFPRSKTDVIPRQEKKAGEGLAERSPLSESDKKEGDNPS